MPDKSLRFCRHHGCIALTDNAYCDKHAAEGIVKQKHFAEADSKRAPSHERGYDGDWRKARAAYLRSHTLCERCLSKGVVTPATMVHHKQALRNGGDRLNSANFMALCFNCHEIVEGRKCE